MNIVKDRGLSMNGLHGPFPIGQMGEILSWINVNIPKMLSTHGCLNIQNMSLIHNGHNTNDNFSSSRIFEHYWLTNPKGLIMADHGPNSDIKPEWGVSNASCYTAVNSPGETGYLSITENLHDMFRGMTSVQAKLPDMTLITCYRGKIFEGYLLNLTDAAAITELILREG